MINQEVKRGGAGGGGEGRGCKVKNWEQDTRGGKATGVEGPGAERGW